MTSNLHPLVVPKVFGVAFGIKSTIKRDMGRIRTRLIKRTANELVSKHKTQFTESFDHNKKTVDEVSEVSTKKLRNKIAGYVTKLVKTTKD